MPSWKDIEAAAPELASLVQARFDAHLHKTMATLRKDGSPRISGTEVKFAAGNVWIGSMGGALKAKDLQRDGRCAFHSAPLDTDMADADAKIAGVATEIHDLGEIRRVWPEWEEHHAPGGAHAFRIDVTEVSAATVEGGQMVIRSWNPSDGERVRERS
ncbi:pyridoxamine 5'-phosphate oxidase family protein [Actinospongicola halichondriae]|uniref:pyridoxamine 5'-phosphate oxidase family protein n=1 Tax=Actinospongicola halichondriae TaxID=3236844 RepID=UPI003D44FE68